MRNGLIGLIWALLFVAGCDGDKRQVVSKRGAYSVGKLGAEAQLPIIPKILDLAVATVEDIPVESIDFLSEENRINGFSLELVTPPTLGVIIQSPEDSGILTFQPNPNVYGNDFFQYKLVHLASLVESDVINVDVVIGAVNDLPTANPIQLTVLEDSGDTVVNIEDYVSDADEGDVVAFVPAGITRNLDLATFAFAEDNRSFTYTPRPNRSGDDSFTVQITDGVSEQTILAPVIVKVAPVNDKPELKGLADTSTFEDSGVVSQLRFSAIDVEEGDVCEKVKVTSNKEGVIDPAAITIVKDDQEVGSNCLASFSPVFNANGPVELEFSVQDSEELVASFPVKVLVEAVNDSPEISSIDDVTIDEETSTDALAFTISDVDNDVTCAANITKSSSNTSLVSTGGIVISGDKQACEVRVTPNANQSGTAIITVAVSDGKLSRSESFILTVVDLNEVPTITNIIDRTQNILEDSSTGSLAFVIDDTEDSLRCDANVAATSSNPAIIANSGIVISGGNTENCSVKVTPIANANGGPVTIVLTVTDSANATATSNFTVAVAAVNDAPTITSIDDIATAEDTDSEEVAFTISDIDSAITCAAGVSGTSSNPALIPSGNIAISGGSTKTCGVVVTPLADQNGEANITLTVTDGVLSSTETFKVTVNSANDAPTITAIANQTTDEDTQSAPVQFTIADDDSISCSDVTAVSADITKILSSAVAISAVSGSVCAVRVTPRLNQNGGPIAITLTVKDSGNLTASTAFNMTITPVNDAPQISAINDIATAEDTPSDSAAFTISDADVDSGISCGASVSGSSDNAALIPNANIAISGQTTSSCGVVVTPLADQNGEAIITLTVTDGVLESTESFKVTVDSANDAPTITSINDQTTLEDTQSAAAQFSVADDGSISCSDVTAVSANNTKILNSGVAIATVSGNLCAVRVTPRANQNGGPIAITLTVKDSGNLTASTAFNMTITPVNDAPQISAINNIAIDEDSSSDSLAFTITDIDSDISCATGVSGASGNIALIPNGNIAVSGGTTNSCGVIVTPLANQNGNAIITLTVTDGALSSTESFSVTVNAANDAPTITSLNDQTTLEDTQSQPAQFTVEDIDGAISCSDVIAVSANNTKILNSGVSISTVSGNLCSVRVTPRLNQNGGPIAITLTVKDSGNLTASTSFNMTITPVNDAPQITPIENFAIAEDTASNSVAFTISDVDSDISCGTDVTGTSSNVALIQNADIAISGGTTKSCGVIVTPLANQNGDATISLTVTDGLLVSTESFVVTVNESNDAPTITNIDNRTQVIDEDDQTGLLTFEIDDSDGAVTCGTSVTATSSNEAIILNSGIVITGGASKNCQVQVTSIANANGGPVFIDLTVKDEGNLTATSSFTVTVRPIADDPTISAVADQTIDEDESTVAQTFRIADNDEALVCTNAVSATSSDADIILDSGITVAADGDDCIVVVSPVANKFGGPTTVTLTVTDSSGRQATEEFAVQVNSVNDTPTISSIQDITIDEDTATSEINFTIGDVEDGVACNANVSGTSSNAVVVIDTNIMITGEAGVDCKVVVTPNAGINGNTDISIAITDNDGAQAVATFRLTVRPVNDAPTITEIDDQVIDEDTSTSELAFAINDIDDNVSCAASVGASSSDQGVIPNANIVIAGGNTKQCTVTVTPAADRSISAATITLTVTDSGGLEDQTTFSLDVNPVNDAPTISAIDGIKFPTNGTGVADFSISDIKDTNDALDCASAVAASSSNEELLPASAVVFTEGEGGLCVATMTPATDASGESTLVLTVTDAGGATADSEFLVTVQDTFELDGRLQFVAVAGEQEVLSMFSFEDGNDDDHIISFGTSQASGETEFKPWLSKQNSAGLLDTNFGVNGTRSLSTAVVKKAVAAARVDDAILLVASTNDQPPTDDAGNNAVLLMQSVGSDGVLDLDFGVGGDLNIELPETEDEVVSEIGELKVVRNNNGALIAYVLDATLSKADGADVARRTVLITITPDFADVDVTLVISDSSQVAMAVDRDKFMVTCFQRGDNNGNVFRCFRFDIKKMGGEFDRLTRNNDFGVDGVLATGPVGSIEVFKTGGGVNRILIAQTSAGNANVAELHYFDHDGKAIEDNNNDPIVKTLSNAVGDRTALRSIVDAGDDNALVLLDSADGFLLTKLAISNGVLDTGFDADGFGSRTDAAANFEMVLHKRAGTSRIVLSGVKQLFDDATPAGDVIRQFQYSADFVESN